MRTILEWLALALIGGVLVAAFPATALAQDDEGEDEAADEEAGEGDEEAEEEEPASEPAVDSSLFAGDDEEPAGDADEEEEEAAEETVEPKILQGTWTKEIIFATDDGSFKFRPQGWIQPRFGLIATPDNDDALAGTGFSLKRGRFGMQAWLFDFAAIYLDMGFASGYAALIDYYADIDPFDGVAVLRVGRFRPYIGRQILQSTYKLQMIEYAQAWEDPMLGLDLGRDLGAGIHGMIADTVEYGVGVWNGERGNWNNGGGFTANGVPYPANIDFTMGARLVAHPLAPAGIGTTLPLGDESDCGISDKPGLAVGAAVMYNKRHDRDVYLAAPVDDYALYYDNQIKLGVELAFKMMGFSLEGEFFMHKVWVQDDAAQEIKDQLTTLKVDPMTGALIEGTGIGAYAQLGYFVMPRKLELAARFDMVDESTDLRGTRMYPGFGGTWYFFGHNLKAQLMYRLAIANGYEEVDPGYMPTSHGVWLMLQAAI